MPLFVCDKCECVDNTALGFYWCRRNAEKYFGEPNGTCLCSECMPDKFLDGSSNRKGGRWHNRFKKEKWDGIAKMENR